MTSLGSESPSLRLLADEDFNGGIVRGLLIRTPGIDLLTVHAVGLAHTDDRVILEWAATEGRIVLTHDERTMIGHAYDRVRAGRVMTGLVVISQTTPVGVAIESVLILLGAATAEEVRDRVLHLPF